MKWFKHEITKSNPKIKRLMKRHGAEGYAAYFQIVEIVNDNYDPKVGVETCFIPLGYTEDMQFFTEELGVSSEAELSAILETCYELNLLKKRDDKIFCEKLIDRVGEYAEKVQRQKQKMLDKNKSVPTVSRHNPDSVPTISENVPLDKIRIHKNRIHKNNTKEINKEKDSTSLVISSLEKPLKEINPYSKLDGLTEVDFVDISERYRIPLPFVESKYDDLRNWCGATGKKYKDYRAALINWVKKDAQKLALEQSKTINKFSVLKL